ncbi:hypothetical protein B0H21DRAFT_454401 [Amylocystis lapponica]|nr:hypothetical protein B0H21DRAFT_454401 [Amylocystis lapponica]
MSKSAALGQALGALFTKRRSASISLIDPLRANKIALHPYLRHSASSPAMYLDLRLNPSTLRFRALERPINEWDLTRFACEPPLAHMRLYNAHFPWFVDVESGNPAGVTLHELFAAIYASMMMPITQADFWNNEMDESVRERIGLAWAQRCADEEERSRGVRRVDFLMGRVVMEGLAKGKDGSWEMRLRKL